MSEMIKAYQEINKRRQSDGMDVNSLTMFAEAWDFQQAKIDELQARVDDALDMLKGRKGKVLLDDIVDTLKGNKDE